MTRLVLASGSPRRRSLLQEMGYVFEVRTSDVVEEPAHTETGAECALRLARSKAAAVADHFPGAVVVAADTVVVRQEHILGKPTDLEDLRRMMRLLSGVTHQVVTAVVVTGPRGTESQAVSTDVSFRLLGTAEMDWYWATGEPHDKAGGYALQGLGGAFIERIDGSHSNVIGLPMVETVAMLERAGVPAPWKTS
jgi:septum formation protein